MICRGNDELLGSFMSFSHSACRRGWKFSKNGGDNWLGRNAFCLPGPGRRNCVMDLSAGEKSLAQILECGGGVWLVFSFFPPSPQRMCTALVVFPFYSPSTLPLFY